MKPMLLLMSDYVKETKQPQQKTKQLKEESREVQKASLFFPRLESMHLCESVSCRLTFAPGTSESLHVAVVMDSDCHQLIASISQRLDTSLFR